MDTARAIAKGMRACASGARHRVFDWNKAARLIRESKATSAVAGLASDMEWTSGEILTEGKPTSREDTYVFLASNWATPVIVLDGAGEVGCWAYADATPKWDAHTYWPKSALAILTGK
jgi:hypothetical protein